MGVGQGSNTAMSQEVMLSDSEAVTTILSIRSKSEPPGSVACWQHITASISKKGGYQSTLLSLLSLLIFFRFFCGLRYHETNLTPDIFFDLLHNRSS